jgi:UrcA family protein
MTGKKWAALAAAMTLALPAAAFAGSNDTDVIVDGALGTETRSITVSLGDLDLASRHGAQMADSRVTKAAKKVCGWMNGTIQQPTREFRTCYGDAIGGARSDLNRMIDAQRLG